MAADDETPPALHATDVPQQSGSGYPEEYARRVAGRARRRLGDAFGLSNIGVNLTTLAPGAQSALLHRHHVADEFVYILEGTPLLRTDAGEQRLHPGMCAGFPAKGIAHHLVNDTDTEVVYLEISDRLPGDGAEYPEDDLAVHQDATGRWRFIRKDGSAC